MVKAAAIMTKTKMSVDPSSGHGTNLKLKRAAILSLLATATHQDVKKAKGLAA
jgi:hypothetical protein